MLMFFQAATLNPRYGNRSELDLAHPVRVFPSTLACSPQYNPLVEDGNDLEILDRDNKVSWSATAGIWPCRPRDFVTHIRRASLADGSVAIVNSATTHPKVVPT